MMMLIGNLAIDSRSISINSYSVYPTVHSKVKLSALLMLRNTCMLFTGANQEQVGEEYITNTMTSKNPQLSKAEQDRVYALVSKMGTTYYCHHSPAPVDKR